MASVTSITSPDTLPQTRQTSTNKNQDDATGPSSTSGTDGIANEQTFLTLLVSQLKNQNPLSPMDGTQFVTQLAQFSDLEQNLAMRQDIDSITKKYVGTTDSGTTDTGTSSTAAGNGSTGSASDSTGTQKSADTQARQTGASGS